MDQTISVASRDGMVEASATTNGEITRVGFAPHASIDQVESGVVEAVNEVLDKAEEMHIGVINEERAQRIDEFGDVLASLQGDLDRARSGVRGLPL